jgi:hypothetical protein
MLVVPNSTINVPLSTTSSETCQPAVFKSPPAVFYDELPYNESNLVEPFLGKLTRSRRVLNRNGNILATPNDRARNCGIYAVCAGHGDPLI